MRQTGLFGLSDHLKRRSAYGDPLKQLSRIIDFEAFRPTLVAALACGDGAKGGRPPCDPVAMLASKPAWLHPPRRTQAISAAP